MKIGEVLLDLDDVSWVFISSCGNYRSDWFFLDCRENPHDLVGGIKETLWQGYWWELDEELKLRYENSTLYYADITQLLITRYGLKTDPSTVTKGT